VRSGGAESRAPADARAEVGLMSAFRAGRLGFLCTTCVCLVAACASIGGCAKASGTTAAGTTSQEVLGQNVSVVATGWSVDAARLTLQDRIYVRGIGYLTSVIADPAWSITAEDTDRLTRVNWRKLDSTKIDDAAALAAIVTDEVKGQTAPDSLTAPLHASWLDAVTQDSSALAEAKTAIARQDGTALLASLAKVAEAEKTISSLLSQHLAGQIDLPILPTNEESLTKREQTYVVRLRVADDSLTMPLLRIQKVLEEDSSDSPGGIASALAGEIQEIRDICDWWTYGIAPSERLLETGTLWDSVMSHARLAMDSLDQTPAQDPAAMAKIRVMLRLVVMETRSVRVVLSQFTPSKSKQLVSPGYAAAPARSPGFSG
jgi:hypothetical protein